LDNQDLAFFIVNVDSWEQHKSKKHLLHFKDVTCWRIGLRFSTITSVIAISSDLMTKTFGIKEENNGKTFGCQEFVSGLYGFVNTVYAGLWDRQLGLGFSFLGFDLASLALCFYRALLLCCGCALRGSIFTAPVLAAQRVANSNSQ
ncbi:hypothetical protein Tsp_02177, partial [Trichinella spiralis]|uniref:hypothetical protein n=1 Tax=Trichinella spiralis TaxID=6334 RepID=UPI0001EFC4B9